MQTWRLCSENKHGYMSHVKRKPDFCICKNKDADATRILQSLYFLNLKFQASRHILWQYSPICVWPGQKPRRPVFSQRGLYNLHPGSSWSDKSLHCLNGESFQWEQRRIRSVCIVKQSPNLKALYSVKYIFFNLIIKLGTENWCVDLVGVREYFYWWSESYLLSRWSIHPQNDSLATSLENLYHAPVSHPVQWARSCENQLYACMNSKCVYQPAQSDQHL